MKENNSSTFGLISFVLSVLACFTPKFLVTLMLAAAAIFIIISLVKDTKKGWAVSSIFLCGFYMYLIIQDEMEKLRTYEVTYRVVCGSCKIQYTTNLGEKEEHVIGSRIKKEYILGTDLASLSVSNTDNEYREIIAHIDVDGKEVERKSSSGRFASVYLSILPWAAYND